MEKHIIQRLVEEHQEVAGEDYVLSCRSYSGRGMYGRECLGVNASDLKSFYSELFALVLERDEPLKRYDRTELLDALMGASTDSMGRDAIIYFSGIDFVGEEQDEEEVEEEETEEA